MLPRTSRTTGIVDVASDTPLRPTVPLLVIASRVQAMLAFSEAGPRTFRFRVAAHPQEPIAENNQQDVQVQHHVEIFARQNDAAADASQPIQPQHGNCGQ